MRITLAQLNYHVGNFERNRDLICDAIERARTEGSDLVVFSELSVCGYPPLDLLDRHDFVEQCIRTAEEIASKCRGIAAIVGSPTFNDKPEGKKLYNSALFLLDGKIVFSANKALLPTYDIFDEYRYFEPERKFSVFEYKGSRIALTICEDLWDEQPFDNKWEKSRLYSVSPSDELASCNPDILINISASPFSYTKILAREEIFRAKARKHKVPVLMVNQTGANTELIFDGSSLAINDKGDIIRRLPEFRQAVETIELSDTLGGQKGAPESQPDRIAFIHKALVTGISDYFTKSGFTKAVVGLSGGIDSAVVLALACEALGSDNLRALLMPSRYSSEHSVSDAVKLAATLGVRYDIISIEKPFKAFEEELSAIFGNRERDVTEENIQARIRAVLLMALANKEGYILLNTSNKSEAAVGYGTLYGDMAGGLSVIGDVYKTDIYRLARLINLHSEVIPENILLKPPSAELRPDQYDTDSLPEYGMLDQILFRYIELQEPPSEIHVDGVSGPTLERVIKMINSNEHKRYQAPPVLRISSKAFGDGRRMPLVARYSF